jgi:membrane peptidoglycan carboxypeptidase
VKRLVRLIVIIGLSSAVVVGGIVGIGVVVHGVVHDTADATEIPLPPLTDKPLNGSTIYADDGTTVLAVEQADKLRVPVKLSEVPKVLIEAVLDTEDAGFYTHGGLDVRSAIRAAANDSSGSSGLQGGSDITQQLVKQTYVGSEKTLSRKVKEAVLADRLQQKYSKNQILDAYLNTVYLGSGAYGMEAAANVFFDEDVSKLTLPQAALLAGNIQSPSRYDPISDPTAARIRRSEVLARMVKEHSISQAQADAADVSPLPTTTTTLPTPQVDTPDYDYVQQVVAQLLAPGSPLGATAQERHDALYEGGLKIVTNLDPNLQNDAEAAVAKDTPANTGGFEEALVSIDPSTGKVRALVGGATQFDVATQGGRQPGSGFKIFTLLAALEQGYSINSAVDATAPCAIAFPPSATGTPYSDDDLLKSPAENDEGPGSGGETTIGNSTAQSYNCAFLRIAHEIKLTSVISMASQLGINAKTLSAVPAMVLGADPASPVQMAGAYAAVADGGVFHAPTYIDHIVDRTGTTIYTGQAQAKQVVSATIAAEATTAFRDVVTEGTGVSAAVTGHEVAGKTGTASGPVDAWFNGFTPQLATTVWMGNPVSETKMVVDGAEVYGGTYPAKTFKDFMTAALAGQPDLPLTMLTGSQIPYGKAVSSPALSRDDKLHPKPPAPAVTAPAATTTVPGATATTVPGAAPPVTAPPDTTPTTPPAAGATG